MSRFDIQHYDTESEQWITCFSTNETGLAISLFDHKMLHGDIARIMMNIELSDNSAVQLVYLN